MKRVADTPSECDLPAKVQCPEVSTTTATSGTDPVIDTTKVSFVSSNLTSVENSTDTLVTTDYLVTSDTQVTIDNEVAPDTRVTQYTHVKAVTEVRTGTKVLIDTQLSSDTSTSDIQTNATSSIEQNNITPTDTHIDTPTDTHIDTPTGTDNTTDIGTAIAKDIDIDTDKDIATKFNIDTAMNIYMEISKDIISDIAKETTMNIDRDMATENNKDTDKKIVTSITKDISMDIAMDITSDSTKDTTTDIVTSPATEIAKDIHITVANDIVNDSTTDTGMDITEDTTEDIAKDTDKGDKQPLCTTNSASSVLPKLEAPTASPSKSAFIQPQLLPPPPSPQLLLAIARIQVATSEDTTEDIAKDTDKGDKQPLCTTNSASSVLPKLEAPTASPSKSAFIQPQLLPPPPSPQLLLAIARIQVATTEDIAKDPDKGDKQPLCTTNSASSVLPKLEAPTASPSKSAFIQPQLLPPPPSPQLLLAIARIQVANSTFKQPGNLPNRDWLKTDADTRPNARTSQSAGPSRTPSVSNFKRETPIRPPYNAPDSCKGLTLKQNLTSHDLNKILDAFLVADQYANDIKVYDAIRAKLEYSR